MQKDVKHEHIQKHFMHSHPNRFCPCVHIHLGIDWSEQWPRCVLYLYLFGDDCSQPSVCIICSHPNCVPICLCSFPSILFSLHTCSVWETICDARASQASRIFGSFCQEYPILEYCHLLPSPQMKSWPELGTLHFDYPGIPPFPSPQKWKVGQNLALWVLTTQDNPPPPNEKLARTWHFEFWLPKNPPRKSCSWSVWRLITVSPKDTISFVSACSYLHKCPNFQNFWLILPRIPYSWVVSPSPPNEKLARTWHFEFSLPKNTSPQWKVGK